MIKKLCIISKFYPSAEDPVYAFVGTLIERFAERGVECHVIAAVDNVEKKHRSVTRVERTPGGKEIHVWCPSCMVFPNRKLLGFQTYRLTVASQRRAIWRAFQKHVGSCDAIYSHFLDSGINAAWLSKKTGIPAFAAVGESKIENNKLAYENFRTDLYEGLQGVITVSTELKNELRKHDVISEKTPIVVYPNSIDTALFRPLDYAACRAALGIPQGTFTVAFLGGFIRRKGFDKLLNVLSRHPDWRCILIGSGELPVTAAPEQVAFCGKVPHSELPQKLCAADVFALPTLAEGCCNAIVEAMGCGLPIVSSNLPFNDDILDDGCSIRIDPEDETALETALERLAADAPLRERLRSGAAERGKTLDIVKRAENILCFMENNGKHA